MGSSVNKSTKLIVTALKVVGVDERGMSNAILMESLEGTRSTEIGKHTVWLAAHLADRTILLSQCNDVSLLCVYNYVAVGFLSRSKVTTANAGLMFTARQAGKRI